MPDLNESKSATGVIRFLSIIRRGPRPTTTPVIPHQQIDQLPPQDAFDRLLARCLELKNTRVWESRYSSPETKALCMSEELANGPAAAFIDDHEFCHIHPLPEGSLHLTLPSPLREQAIEAGWAEPHPLARTGAVSANLVMVYAPRNELEIEAALALIGASARFAGGL